MALTRARVMASSSPEFAARLKALLSRVITCPRPDLDMPSDIADMLQRLRREKPPRGPWDIKLMQGGARDIEFIAQSLYLARKSDYAEHGLTSTQSMLLQASLLEQVTAGEYEDLLSAHHHFSDLTHYLALTHGGLSGAVEARVIAAIVSLMKMETPDALMAGRRLI